MALLKKINPEWVPSENKSLKVGDVIEMTDYVTLVRTGAAILVDDNGNELPLPGQVFACPICYKGTGTLAQFVVHVDTHKKSTPAVALAPQEEQEEVVESALESVTKQIADTKQEVEAEQPKEAPLYVSKKTLAEEAAKKAKK